MYKVAVCIATYRRPDLLDKLLFSLSRLELPPVSMSVLIVDNDPCESGLGIVAKYKGIFPDMHYGVEPNRGISHVRNRLVHMARELGSELICFVDDDEVVEPAWLLGLVGVADKHGAAVVAGPVIYDVADSAPWWVKATGFFDPPVIPEGSLVRWAGTGNVLIRLSVLDRWTDPFDPQFSLTGGEDTHLFERLTRAGYSLVWTNKAVAHETVTESRANPRWMIRRAYRSATSLALTERLLYGLSLRTLRRLVIGVAQITVGLGLLVFGMLVGRVVRVKALLRIARGVGALAGLLGTTYNEYK